MVEDRRNSHAFGCLPHRFREAAAVRLDAARADAHAYAMRASVAFNILHPFDAERALGADFTRARPEAWWTVPVLIHLPAFVADAAEQILTEFVTRSECAVARASDEYPAGWPS